VRIGIDFTAAAQQGGGIGRLTRNLVGALAQIDRQNEYRLFVATGRGREEEWKVGSLGPDFQTSGHPNFQLKTVPFSDHALAVAWHRLRLPLFVELFTGRVDLFHAPDFTLPPVLRARTLVTVHDLSFLRLPECFPDGLLRYLKAAVPRAIHRADHVIADSHNTRRDLMELLGTPGAEITVIHSGVEPRFRPMTGEADGETLAAVRRKYAPALYNLAGLFTFPSLYEGFGLPPLEAMACGVPVVCSRVSSLPEVVGDAALTVDPLDVTGLAEAMRQAIEDETLRASLVARGSQRAATFTWSKAAEELLTVYSSIA